MLITMRMMQPIARRNVRRRVLILLGLITSP
jgi:hypothetical protein